MGLVEYASSDEENDDERLQTKDGQIQEAKPDEIVKSPAEADLKTDEKDVTLKQQNEPDQHAKKKKTTTPIIGPSMMQSDMSLGPFLPSMDQPEQLESDQGAQEEAQEPRSPYTSNRALIHDLTLPSVPNLDIPPSPPGSPPPGANAKMEQFLDLKSKGIHFNAKLEQSTALKNPSLMDKLLAYVDIDDAAQYATTLPLDLWDPASLPEWAFRERLRKTRERIFKEKEAEKASGSRTSVEFVASKNSSSAGSVLAGGLSSKNVERKEGWK